MKWINRFGLNWPIPFKTTKNERLHLPEIQDTMVEAKLPADFIKNAVSIAYNDQGVYELMNMWLSSTSQKERNDIINDIQGLINDYKRTA